MGVPQVKAAVPFSERLGQLVQRVEYRRAETDQDREAIYRLRYEAYLRERAIEPSFGRRLADRYDDLDNAWLIGLHIDGRLASSLRIHVANSEYSDIVAADVFGDVVRPLLDAGKVVVDPTRFVADAEMARRYPELPYLTVRVACLATEYFNADVVLATVRQEHRAFYRRVFGHVSVCEPRPYPLLIKPLGLMMLDVPSTAVSIAERYPSFTSTPEERAQVFGPRPVPAEREPGTAIPLAG
jgi:hypothetical protein